MYVCTHACVHMCASATEVRSCGARVAGSCGSSHVGAGNLTLVPGKSFKRILGVAGRLSHQSLCQEIMKTHIQSQHPYKKQVRIESPVQRQRGDSLGLPGQPVRCSGRPCLQLGREWLRLRNISRGNLCPPQAYTLTHARETDRQREGERELPENHTLPFGGWSNIAF